MKSPPSQNEHDAKGPAKLLASGELIPVLNNTKRAELIWYAAHNMTNYRSVQGTARVSGLNLHCPSRRKSTPPLRTAFVCRQGRIVIDSNDVSVGHTSCQKLDLTHRKEPPRVANALSPCITTTKVEESREFYVRHFGAKVIFDCGGYVNIEFGKGAALQFMAPQPHHPTCNPAGLTYNFSVSDVDAEFQSLAASGLAAIIPLEDHPWGDRGFAVQDPNGIVLYIYSEREPSPEFKQYFKT